MTVSAHCSDCWSSPQQGQLLLLSQRLLQKPWHKNGFEPSVQKSAFPPPKLASGRQNGASGARSCPLHGEKDSTCVDLSHPQPTSRAHCRQRLSEKNSGGLLLCWRVWAGTSSCSRLGGWGDIIVTRPLGMGCPGDWTCSVYSMLLLCCPHSGGADTKALVSAVSSVIINLSCIRRLTYC